MKHHQVVIIGGGPAGAACAGRLVSAGADVLLLDKSSFPRKKTCAGWITPQVLSDLDLDPSEYPYSLSKYQALRIFLKGIPILWPGDQYAIRRIEFDDWLLKRSGAAVKQHHVRRITRENGRYILDDAFSADYLVGAGGTHCPVYHALFREEHPRTGSRIAALEAEFSYEWKDGKPRLWFFDRGLAGYAWYLPKVDGYLNIGLGGDVRVLKKSGRTIQEHWGFLLEKLRGNGLISGPIPDPDGYVYHLRGPGAAYRIDNAFLVGDAAGLASLDMGEGIGPALESGQLAAEAILHQRPYTLESISQFSLLPGWLGWLMAGKAGASPRIPTLYSRKHRDT